MIAHGGPQRRQITTTSPFGYIVNFTFRFFRFNLKALFRQGVVEVFGAAIARVLIVCWDDDAHCEAQRGGARNARHNAHGHIGVREMSVPLNVRDGGRRRVECHVPEAGLHAAIHEHAATA